MNSTTSTKIRIRLESFNNDSLNLSCKTIINLFQNVSSDTISVIALPTKKRIYCVLRSPHVDKDSREHFEIRVHKRVIEIDYESDKNIFDLLTDANLPSGVLCRINFDS